MSNTSLHAGRRQAANDSGHVFRKSDALGAEPDAPPKTMRAKWHKRLQRGLFKVWIGCSVVWIGGILAILGRCVYGPWIGWRQPQCEGLLANAVETYLTDIALALGPPAAVILLYRLVMWWSSRVGRNRSSFPPMHRGLAQPRAAKVEIESEAALD